jgi:hypothetical protein
MENAEVFILAFFLLLFYLAIKKMQNIFAIKLLQSENNNRFSCKE